MLTTLKDTIRAATVALAAIGFGAGIATVVTATPAEAQVVDCSDPCGQFASHMADDTYTGGPSSNMVCFFVQSDEQTAIQMRLDRDRTGPIIGQMSFRRQSSLWENLGEYGFRREVCMTRALWNSIRESGRWLNPCGALGNYDIEPGRNGLEWIERHQNDRRALMRRPICLSGEGRCDALGLNGF